MSTEFVELYKPCPVCNSSDACSINEDGSAKCFSCGDFFPDYYKEIGEEKPMVATVTNLKDKKKNTMSGQVATSPEMNPNVDYKY